MMADCRHSYRFSNYNFVIISRSYCYTVWWAIGIWHRAYCCRPSVCDAVQYGSQSWCITNMWV